MEKIPDFNNDTNSRDPREAWNDPMDPQGTMDVGRAGEELTEDKHEDARAEVSDIMNKHVSRRSILKLGLGAAAGLAAGKLGIGTLDDKKPDPSKLAFEDSLPMKELEKEGQEKVPTDLTPLKQLVEYHRIKDMSGGIEATRREHYSELGESNDMRETVGNMHKLLDSPEYDLDVDDVVEPFKSRNLESWLGTLIAAQETRWEVTTSDAGARGITGIMPPTAKDLKDMGYIDIDDPKDVDDPAIALKATAGYLAWERDNFFGERNTDLCLHAYNGGWTLCGFTEYARDNEIELTSENFYDYMQGEVINRKIDENTENENYVHTLDDRSTTLIDVGKLFDVSLETLLATNPDLDPKSMVRGETKVAIPLDEINAKTWRYTIFRKEFEMLNYVPELKAKLDYLRDHFSDEIPVTLPEEV